MNQVRDSERDKLTKLTLESNAGIKELKRQKEKVKRCFSSEDHNEHILHCEQTVYILFSKLYTVI